MTTATKPASRKTPSKATPSKSATKKPSTRSADKTAPAKKAPAKKSAAEGNHCWPGFEPTPGKIAGEKGSCKPKAGKQSPAVKKADSKAAAASKLQK